MLLSLIPQLLKLLGEQVRITLTLLVKLSNLLLAQLELKLFQPTALDCKVLDDSLLEARRDGRGTLRDTNKFLLLRVHLVSETL